MKNVFTICSLCTDGGFGFSLTYKMLCCCFLLSRRRVSFAHFLHNSSRMRRRSREKQKKNVFDFRFLSMKLFWLIGDIFMKKIYQYIPLNLFWTSGFEPFANRNIFINSRKSLETSDCSFAICTNLFQLNIKSSFKSFSIFSILSLSRKQSKHPDKGPLSHSAYHAR